MEKPEFNKKNELKDEKAFTTVEEADSEFLETSMSSLEELMGMCGEENSKFKEIFSKELDNHKDKLEELKK